MIAEIFLSYLALTQQAELQPQWNYMQKLLEVYMCSGDPTWTDKIPDNGIRGLFNVIFHFLCDNPDKRRTHGESDFSKVIKTLSRNNDDFRCFKSSFFLYINRIVCTKPIIIYDIISRRLTVNIACHSERAPVQVPLI